MAEYRRLTAEWLTNGRRPPSETPDHTVNELLLASLRFADGDHRKNGEPTKEPALLRLSVRLLRQLCSHTPARDSGPLALKSI